jgi:hypothetical protein
LVIDYWLLVVGYWLLVIGYWLLVIVVETQNFASLPRFQNPTTFSKPHHVFKTPPRFQNLTTVSKSASWFHETIMIIKLKWLELGRMAL